MKRSGFKRPELAPTGTRPAPYSSLTRGVLKRRTKRPTIAEGAKYLHACRGEDCYLRVPGVCRFIPNDETVVACHSNSQADGKGMGKKASHDKTVPGCALCHQWLDQGPAPREAKRNVFCYAMLAWIPVRAKKLGEFVPWLL